MRKVQHTSKNWLLKVGLVASIVLMASPALACRVAPPQPPPAQRVGETDAQYQVRLSAYQGRLGAQLIAQQRRQQLANQAEYWGRAAQIAAFTIVEAGEVDAVKADPSLGKVPYVVAATVTWIKGQGPAGRVRITNQLTSCGPGYPLGAVGDRLVIFATAGPITPSTTILYVRQGEAHDPRLASAFARTPRQRPPLPRKAKRS